MYAATAREFILSLPHELNLDQRRALVRAFISDHLTPLGVIADAAFHRPDANGDRRNFHAHILTTTREVGPDGFAGKLRTVIYGRHLRIWRAGWSTLLNAHLERHLGPKAPQVSHLTLAEQGIDRLPLKHLGRAATALERSGERTQRGEDNRDIALRNVLVAEDRREYQRTADRLAEAAPRIDASVDELITEATRVKGEHLASRARLEVEREALSAIKPPRPLMVERMILAEDRAAVLRARGALEATKARVNRIRTKRLGLSAWIRTPSRMIWAGHAEQNALSRARHELRRAQLRLHLVRAWLRSPQGRALIEARRTPDLSEAQHASARSRTVLRKIWLETRRIEASGEALKALELARDRGVRRLLVPTHSPDPQHFIRDVGMAALDAVARHPHPERLNLAPELPRTLGRTISPLSPDGR